MAVLMPGWLDIYAVQVEFLSIQQPKTGFLRGIPYIAGFCRRCVHQGKRCFSDWTCPDSSPVL